MQHVVRAVHLYQPRFEDELALEPGDVITVLQDVKGGWWYGRQKDKARGEGWFPSNYVVELENHAPASSQVAPQTAERHHKGLIPKQGGKSQAHPQPLQTTAPQNTWQQQQRQERTPEQHEQPREREDEHQGEQEEHEQEQHNEERHKPNPSSSARATRDRANVGTSGMRSGVLKRPSLTRMSQRHRSTINSEIEKQLRIRDGAERMLQTLDIKGKGKSPRRKPSRRGKASSLQQQSTPEMQREEAFLTLSYANSRLQQLRRQLQALNSTVQATARQSVLRPEDAPLPEDTFPSQDTEVDILSMIALGLKETAPADISGAIGRVLEGHFYQSAGEFESALQKLGEMRQFVETYIRSGEARAMLFAYYHQLIHIEQRFCRCGKLPDLHFKWYDTLNGQPCMQGSIALEKACVLFNAGALSTQIAGSRQLDCIRELERAKSEYEMAAGTFQYILDNFDNPPSADLSQAFLRFLHYLTLAQAQECIFQQRLLERRRTSLGGGGGGGGEDEVEAEHVPPGEAGAVHDAYTRAWAHVERAALQDYIPALWHHLLRVKMLFYEAVADFATATEQLSEVLETSHNRKAATWTGTTRLCRAEELLLRARHICAAELSSHSGLVGQLLVTLDRVQTALQGHDKDSIFDQFSSKQQLLDMLSTKPDAAELAQPTYPELGVASDGTHLSLDLFGDVGPVQLFNAWNTIGPMRRVDLPTKSPNGLGVVLGGSKPVIVHKVTPGGAADGAGLLRGDVVVRVRGEDCRYLPHKDVVTLLKGAEGNSVAMAVQHIDVSTNPNAQQTQQTQGQSPIQQDGGSHERMAEDEDGLPT